MPHEIPVADEALDILRGDQPSTVSSAGPNWPDPLRNAAYYGVVGELVRRIEPHSEADPAALLIQLLVGLGSLIGRTAYFLAEADRHFLNLFAVIVGLTAKARKGTSWGHVKTVLRQVDEVWSSSRVLSGLSSGEGLIWAVRDAITAFVKGEEQIVDPGVSDKRLLVVESEFARVLQTIERPGNTLSALLRDSWDTGQLASMTKNSPARATGAHISILGHITKDELRRLLTDTAAANGFANRFLWVCSKRSKCLPDGGALDQGDLSGLVRRLQDAANFAQGLNRMQRDDEARAIWRAVYPELSEGKPGLLGSVTSRAEAQTMRLEGLYAILDCSAVSRAEHLTAALEVWRYCEASARWIFGEALGDPTADDIIRALRQRPDGMTRTQIRDLFGRHKSADEINRALTLLTEYGRAYAEQVPTGEGRPAERWRAV